MTNIEWTQRPGTKGETWNPVKRYPYYEVSSHGRIRNKLTAKVLKPITDRSGHLYVFLYEAGRRRGTKQWVHRIVLEAFKGVAPKGQEARHLNGNPADNNIRNLAWGDRLEQREDDRRNGVSRVNGRTLTESEVKSVRASSKSNRALATEYGVSHTTIRKARKGIRYSNV